MSNIVDGKIFEGMLKNAFNNLVNHENEVNAMNVFPVADGDTGTNMRLTVQHGLNAKSNVNLGVYLSSVAKEMLLGARGNSGVILSQLFFGLARSLVRHSYAYPREMANALIYGYRTAYKAVINPVEGTILSVSRLGIENIKTQIVGRMTFEKMYKLYLQEMEKVLLDTPNMLPILKDAGVLDSGAKGYIYLVEGMYQYLLGNIIEKNDEIVLEKVNTQEPAYFDVNSKFEDGYCTEFHLQLMNSKNYRTNFRYENFVKELSLCGNSLVVVQNDTIVKVHIHTLIPSKVIDIAQKYGEFISFKLENMQVQHNEFSLTKEEQKELIVKQFAIIACVDGSGVKTLFKDLGADVIVDGGQSMNPSVNDFADAIKQIKADTIVIYPNNENIIETANQAKKLFKDRNIVVIPTTSIIEGYYSLAMDVPDGDTDTRLSCLKSGFEGVISLSVSKAIKEYEGSGVKCSIGDEVSCINHKVIAADKDLFISLKTCLDSIEDLSEKSGVIVLTGNSCPEEIKDEIEDFFIDNYDNLEVSVLEGKQGVYELLIGVI